MFKNLKFEELGEGALLIRANQMMEEVVANIHDLNTDALSPREVNIKIKFNADKTRRFVQTTMYVSGRMAPPRAVGMMLVSDCKDGKGLLYGSNPNQTQLFDEVKEPAIVEYGEYEEEDEIVVEEVKPKSKKGRK